MRGIPSRRFHLALAAAAAAAGFSPALSFSLGALLALLAALDAWAVRRARDLRIRVEAPAALSQLERGSLGIVVENRGPRTARLRLALDAEPGLADGDAYEARSLDVPQRERKAARFELFARERGSRRIERLHVRRLGPLALWWREERMDLGRVVEVLPAYARERRRRHPARLLEAGERRSPRRGDRGEFESLREYVRGDEVRRIDWKATARRAKPMVRTYQVERGQELVLLLDCGRRMRASGGAGEHAGWTKLDWALDAALELAAVALRQGDRVGAAAFERDLVAYVAPTKGARAQARLAGALFPLQPSERDGDLARALGELALRHRRRATVLVLSDVADPLSLEEQRAALAAGARHHRLIFAALDDPELRRAAEGGGGDAVLRAAALELVAERARSLRTLAASGARVLDALPAEAAAPMLAAWLDERRAG
jgi:uncharacterized protein (DUF58 family)